MLEKVINTIKSIILSFNPVTTFLLIAIMSLFVFWKETSRSRKNNSSVFDMFVLSAMAGVLTSRISYIITMWSDFSSTAWYWLPYEKYGEKVYLFRLLPWKFVAFWDGGIDVLLTVVGFVLTQTVLTLFYKKWRWSNLFPAIYLSNWFMLGLFFLLIGIQGDNTTWAKQGLQMIVPFLIFLLLQVVVVGLYSGRRKEQARMVLQVIFAVIAMVSIGYVYLSSTLNTMSIIGLVILGIWFVWGIILHIIDSNKSNNLTIETLSSVRHISLPEVKKPIRLVR